MRKKIMPVLVVLGLIVLVAAAGIGAWAVKRYTPTKETIDGQTYFGLESEDEAALIVDRQLTDVKLMVVDGRVYVPEDAVGTYINSGFYWDEKQGVMLYSLPTEVFQIAPDATQYETAAGVQDVGYTILRTVDGVSYLDLEFVDGYTDMEYTFYENPNRVVVQTDFSDAQAVVVTADGAAVREKGGIKSPIVTECASGDELYLIEEMEEWSEVATKDGYSGYIKKDEIGGAQTLVSDHVSETVEYTSVRRDYKINMGWHQVTSQEGNAALASVLADTQGLNVISPTWFSVTDNEGTVSSLASADYVEQAHQAGLEVWGLIDNFSADADTLTFLSDTAVRGHIIDQLMQEAEAVGLDGVNLDFETISEEAAPHYVQFIRELSVACRLRGLVFSIDDPVPMSYNTYYNRKVQGEVADYVIIMGYDEHHSSDTEAGSVASLGFVRSGIEDTLQEVAAEKVIIGIPFYTRLWTESYGGGLTNEAMGMDTAWQYVEEHGMDVYWDDTLGQNVATLEGDDAVYSIWLEDEESIREKTELIGEYQLAGVAEWKLGLERASVWPIISEALQ